jgi:hypothetical protein
MTALSACGARPPALPTRPSPYKPAKGSGLLGESQLSLRAEHAYQLSQRAPLRTSQPKALDCCEHHSSLCVRSTPTSSPNAPLSVQASQRLWTAVRITALSAHGVRLPALLRSSPTLPTSPPPDPTRRHQHTNPTSGLTAILHGDTLPKPPKSPTSGSAGITRHPLSQFHR